MSNVDARSLKLLQVSENDSVTPEDVRALCDILRERLAHGLSPNLPRD